MTHPPVRFGLVGCGAVAQAHLPILQESSAVEIRALVDKALPRAQEVADQFQVATVYDDAAALIGEVDAVILAVPHHLHAPISTTLLRGGVHVLVEKPMALTLAECDEMAAAAEAGGAKLAVGQLRRYFYSSQFIKSAIDSGLLGEIQSFDQREGTVYSWPAASDFTIRKESGGGVLADQGAHSLDILLWWLGDVAELQYIDDAEGGVEADCEIHLTLQSGAKGIVELSRTRDLRNSVIIRGSRATIEVEMKFDSQIRLLLNGEEVLLGGRAFRDDAVEEDVNDIFRRQLADFIESIQTDREPFISAREGRRAVAAIETCHRSRQPLAQPWRAWTPG